MKCPACKSQTEEMSVDNIKVDVCRKGCGGIWFDRFELERVDETHESAGERLLELDIDAGVVVDHSVRRRCPKCQDVIMMRHFFSIKREIEVDECPSCAGIWVDRGELLKMRKQFATQEDRDKAAERFFTENFNPGLEMMKREGQERLQKAKRFASLFRFICPSYFIPGKQRGGAF